MHEIIGVSTTTSGLANIIVEENDLLIASGVNILNFEGALVDVVNVGGGKVDVRFPDIQVDGDSLWVYDQTRSKWLSTDKAQFSAGEKGLTKNKYLLTFDSQAINLTGYRMVRDGTITAIAAQTRNAETWTLRVRKNGSATNIQSLAMTAIDGNHSNTVNVDVDEGDRIQFYAETTTMFGIRDPLVWVEIAWRNDGLAAP